MRALPVFVLLLPVLAEAVEPVPRLNVALPGLSLVSLPATRETFFTEHLAAGLARRGAQVTTAKAIGEMLGVERQRQLLGCAESGCTIELANALGADGIVTGELAQIGRVFQVNLKLVSSRNAEVVAAFQRQVTSEEGLLDALNEGAVVLATEGAERLGRSLTPSGAPTAGVRRWSWIPLALGVASGVTGGVMFGLAAGNHAAIPRDGAMPLSYATAAAYAEAGKTQQTLGWVAVSFAVVAVATSVVMFIFGSDGGRP